MDPAQLYWYAAGGFAAFTPAALLARRVDRRLLDGELVWNKPIKFGVSLALHFATFAWASAFLASGRFLTIIAWLSVGAAVLELAYIAAQAARRRRSHFNKDTRLEAAIYAMLGLGALLVLSPAVAVGVAAILAPPPVWPLAVRLAVPFAFLIGAGLTLLITLTMGRKNSRYAGDPPPTPRPMRLTGWTLNAADLRPAHFLGTHIMQGVPAVAIVATWLLPPTTALVAVGIAATGWTWLTLALYQRTLEGRPLPGRSLFLSQQPASYRAKKV